MPPAPHNRKARAGEVSVKVSNGRLQLVFRYGGRRFYLSLGLPNSAANLKAAELKARQIERDIAYGEVDVSLARYRPSQETRPETDLRQEISIAELWKKYTDYRLPSVSPGTVRTVYNHVRRHIEKLPSQRLEDAELIQLDLKGRLSPYSARRILVQLSACCKWAVKARLITQNPFQGMAAEIKVKGKRGSEDNDMQIQPFTLDEQRLIITAFSNSSYYKRYTSLVKFLFATGCRPGEAIALEWRHWIGDDIIFEQAIVVDGDYKSVLKRGLKTQDKRRFPCNPDLKALLSSIKPSDAKPTDLIFSSRQGKLINWYHFSSGPWKKILSLCSIEYRNPYQTRHTFITQCVEAGIPTKHVAKWVGNSEWIISQHYLGLLNQLQVPVCVTNELSFTL